MIQNVLQNSKDNKQLIEFNCYGNESGLYCGYVLDFTADIVVVKHYSKYGACDGILVHKIADIKYLETDTDYLKGLQYLANNQELFFTETYNYKPTNNNTDFNFTDIFESFISDKDYIVKFEISDGDMYFGFIEWCDEDNFLISSIDCDGKNIGKATFKFEDLKSYWIDDLESRKRQILYQYNKPK